MTKTKPEVVGGAVTTLSHAGMVGGQGEITRMPEAKSGEWCDWVPGLTSGEPGSTAKALCLKLFPFRPRSLGRMHIGCILDLTG